MGSRNKYLKKFVFGIFTVVFAGIFLFTPNSFATIPGVSTAEELSSYFQTGGKVRLLSDVTFDSYAYVRADTTLDLNGHVLDMTSYTMIPYGATLTIEDNSTSQTGRITSTASFAIQVGTSTDTSSGLVLNSGHIDCQGSYGIRNFGNLTINGGTVTADDFVVYNQSNSFVMNGGTLYSPAGTVVGNYTEGANFVMNGGIVRTLSYDIAIILAKPYTSFTMNGGTVEANNGDTEIDDGGSAVAGFKYTEVTINGGTLSGFGNTITGNGSDSGNNEGTEAKFTINGGTIISINGAGIYAPQVAGVTTITGGTITGITGVEVRAGILNISGGTIIATGEYAVKHGKSGLSTTGAAVSVAQHSTAQGIIVDITGGQFGAEMPVSVGNPLDFDQATLDQIDVRIKGGEFNGDNLEDVVDNIPRGYTDVEETTSGDKIAVVQVNPLGYYLSATSSGVIDITGLNGAVTSDYSDIRVLSNCHAGYDFVMSTSVEDNTLYPNGDSNAGYYFSAIESDTSLVSSADKWGYLMSTDESFEPTETDLFDPVPGLSNPVALRTASGTATQDDIDDKFRLHFGANIGRQMGLGNYRLERDGSNNPGGIVYRMTASPVCTDYPVEVSFNENTDGEGGSDPDVEVADLPTYLENSIQFEGNVAVTITLSDKTPMRDDYAFVEWNTEADGSGHAYQPGEVIGIGNDSESGELVGVVTLYAIWEEGCAGGTICYDSNGADGGTMIEQTGGRGAGVKLTPSNFDRDGYGFAGWNTKADGTGMLYGPMQTFTIPRIGGTTLYADWIASAGDMQTWDDADLMEIGDITALTDTRDGQTYAVAKLADGKVWMIENFRLDPGKAELEVLNTNHPTLAFLESAKTAASSKDLCGNNSAACFNQIQYNANNLDRTLTQTPTATDGESGWYSYGVYYNWFTATAGNGVYATSDNTTTSGDLCPAGWHLPTGNNGDWVELSEAINGDMTYDVKLRNTPNNFVRGGEFNKTVVVGAGEYARYWSSTAEDNNKAYRFGYNYSSITPNNTWNKWEAFAVRCVYDGERIPSSETTITFGEHVSSVEVSNDDFGKYEITTSGTTIRMAENTEYQIKAEFDEGYTVNTWTTTENGQVGNAGLATTTYEITGTDTLNVSAREATVTSYTLNYDTTPSTDTIASVNGSSYNPSYDFEVSDEIPVVFGETFIGWSETQGGSTVDYEAGDTITLLNSDPLTVTTVNKTLYAVYQENTCSVGNICYFGNGATAGTMGDQAVPTGASEMTLIPSNYSRTGYGFAGWIETENGLPYGPNATISTPDVSESGLMLYAKWIESEQDDMQTWSCSNLQLGEVTALTDNRDGNTYAVAKLGDENCWMIENLRLDIGTANITVANTNNPTSDPLSGGFVEQAAGDDVASSETFCKNNDANCYEQILYNANNIDRLKTPDYSTDNNASGWYSYGVYYNWYTATAGNGTYSTTSASVEGDICPAGWHLPTGGASGEYKTLNDRINGGATTSDVSWRAYPNNFIWSGDYNGNKRTGSYANARLWTSTGKDNKTAFRVGIELGKATPNANAYNKWDGFTVRCMKK